MDDWILENVFKFPMGRTFWNARYELGTVIEASLIPGIVLASVVPILYWRGGLAQRFAISVVMAITTMNIATDPHMYAMHAGRTTIPWRQLIAIAICWTMMPVLFLLTPINTRYLRLIVASGLLLLTLCVSVLHMFEAPGNISLLYWMCVYGAAFCYGLIRRNWGRVAIFEATSNRENIERTSSRTLLEVMVHEHESP